MYKFRLFAIIFLNVDNSVNIETRLFKFCILIVDIIMEGTVSQIFVLCPSSYHMLFRIFFFYKIYKIFWDFCHKKEPRHR